MKNIVGLCVFASIALLGQSLTVEGGGKKKPKNYYPLEKGTKWHYKAKANDQEAKVIYHLKKFETIDRKRLAFLETVLEGKKTYSAHLTSTEKGVFRHRADGKPLTEPLPLIQYPVKKGDSWKSTIAVSGGKKIIVESKVLAVGESVKVPAGTYKTVKIQQDTTVRGDKITTTYWFASDVGMVKQTAETPKVNVVMELEKLEKGS